MLVIICLLHSTQSPLQLRFICSGIVILLQIDSIDQLLHVSSMACNFSSSVNFAAIKPGSKNPKKSNSLKLYPLFLYKSQNFSEENEEERKNKTHLSVVSIPVTLTILSASLVATNPCYAATKVGSERKKKSQKKPQEAWTPEQIKKWAKDLPVVTSRIGYSDILSLKSEGRLKHVIKSPSGSLRLTAEPVLVVLEDSRVLRSVLPSLESDTRFWERWDELNIGSLCVNAYTPPVKKPEVPSPYLGFLSKFPETVLSIIKPKKQSKRSSEVRKLREEFKRQQKEETERLWEERERMEKEVRMRRRAEELRRKREIRNRKLQESVANARQNSINMANMWRDMAKDPNVVNALGVLFFVIFYRTVVLNYKKQKRDYEDRLKIEKAEAEERKKMKQLEREMDGIAAEEDVDESEQGKGEQNEYLKMAQQFMKSGARVRRSHGKRPPQYLERGVDVKFTDVAGLGKIRLELEEIVKFFTHGEMYRRRGVRIPGQIFGNTSHLCYSFSCMFVRRKLHC